MRTRSILGCLLALMAMSSVISQQVANTDPDNEPLFIVTSIGAPLVFQVGAGMQNIINDQIDARVTANITGSGLFAMEANLLLDADPELDPGFVRLYGGAGPAVAFSDTAFNAKVNLFVGVEYRLVDLGLGNMGLFAEAGPSLGVVPDFTTEFLGRLGLHVYFR